MTKRILNWGFLSTAQINRTLIYPNAPLNETSDSLLPAALEQVQGEPLGLEAAGHLSRNDAYPFFHALGDLLKTGPTGTNVNDLIFLCIL